MNAGNAELSANRHARTAWSVAGILARALVGGLFIYAASSKILDPMKFADEVRAYELLPLVVTNAVAIVLPWLELLAGVLLVAGLWRPEARLLILLMMLGFTFGKISVEVRGLNIDCGCFGSAWMEKVFHGIWGIVLNIVLIALLALDYFCQRLAASRRRSGPPATAAARA